MDNTNFPEKMAWGAATASYQIEGAAYEDGKGLSIWDVFCKKEGAVKREENGDVACDHYHRYKDDTALFKEIGLRAYRFSISWPRILPQGTGPVNPKGLEFYDRLVDALLAVGIVPYVTLFHWDYPYELYKQGGWLNKDSSEWFADYARIVADKLSDRVKYWFTFNEPQVITHVGHAISLHAPGLKLGMHDLLQMSHNILLSHGKAVSVIRKTSAHPCKIGMAPVGIVFMPQEKTPERIEAARQMTFSIDQMNLYNNTWWMDPIFLGKYPDDGLSLFEQYMPAIGQNDMRTICQPLDFFSFNMYSGDYIAADQSGKNKVVKPGMGFPWSAFYWPINPECLYWGPKFFHERYRKPIIVSENGMSNIDWVSVNGKVHDPQRIDYLHRHLVEYAKAGKDGVNLHGYFCWSAMDNFEWAEGYQQRFGLIYVDYKTQKRIIKDSGYWYQKLIENNGSNLTEKHND